MLVDLQIHTSPASPDSSISPRELATAAVELKLDGVGVTEHGPPVPGRLKAALDGSGVILLTGREVTLLGSHVLIFSEDEDLLGRLPRLIQPGDPVLHREDAAVLWAHPAAPAGSSAYPPSILSQSSALIELVHAVEVLNGRHLHFEASVSVAEATALAHGLGMTAGSDAHQILEIGRCATRVDSSLEEGAAGVIAALRDGRTEPVLSRRWVTARGYDYRPSLRRFIG